MRQFERQSYGTPIVLAASTYAPGHRVNLGTRTHTITLASLAAGAYRQGPKIDFGADFAEHPLLWASAAAILPTSAPTAGGLISLFLGYSHESGPDAGNPGNLSGIDSAWTGYGAAATDADEMAAQLTTLGSRPVSADAAIQVMQFNVFVPQARYGIPVIKNGASQNFSATVTGVAIRFAPILRGFH